MKKAIAMLLVLCLTLLAFTGCGDDTTEQSGTTTTVQQITGTTVAGNSGTTAAGTATTTTATTAGNANQTPAQAATMVYGEHTVSIAELAGILRIDGRTLTEDNGITFEWTASGFVMEGELEGDVTAKINFPSGQTGCRLRTWVDGKDAKELTLEAGTKSYVLAEGLRKGKHTVRVAKMSDASFSAITISDLSFTGKLTTVAESKRKIEFFGDSITAGIDLYIETADATTNEDGTRTYAALTADTLKAEYRVMAIGGWGCMGGVAGQWQNIPSLLERASYKNASAKWDCADWQADVVVINLGTNDGGYMWANNKTDLEFEACARAYLEDLRAKYPKAHIIWAYGMMGNGLENLVLNVIEDMESVDSKVHYVRLPNTVRGSGYHPGYEDSQASAEVLSDFIKQVTGWK